MTKQFETQIAGIWRENGSSALPADELKSNTKREPDSRNSGYGNRGASSRRGSDASEGWLHPNVAAYRTLSGSSVQPRYVLALQRSVGNQAVQRLLASRGEHQADGQEMPVSAPDPMEFGLPEAGSMAEGAQAALHCARSFSDQPRFTGDRTIQRKCECGGHADSGGECEKCRQTHARPQAVVQRAPADAGSDCAPATPSVHKTFHCPDYAGDAKLEACLNNQDRLTPGTRSESVRKVQNGLLKDHADLGPQGADGVYGPDTARAVVKFKNKYNLGCDQYADVGPGTMAKLDELCAGPTPPPPSPNPVKPTQCFDTIDWDAFFAEKESDCAVTQHSIDALCALAPSSPFNLGPDPCPKTPVEQRIEDCVTDAGFFELFEKCGIPASGGPGKSEIVKRFKDWRKLHP